MGHPLSPAVVDAVQSAASDDRPNPIHVDGLTVLRYSGAADLVGLDLWTPGFVHPGEFRRVDNALWAVAMLLPANARLEYRVGIDGESRLDPLNPHRSSNPFGENSVAVGPRYRPPAWTRGKAEPGRVVEVRVASPRLGGRRRHHLYSPAGSLPGTALPLLVVHDGSDYMRYAELCRAVDVLVSVGAIRPLRLALIDPRKRHEEYVASDDHASHIVDELLPHVSRRVEIAEPLGVMGASLGAVAAWHAARSATGVFRRLFLQSGTFAFEPAAFLDAGMFSSINRFTAEAVKAPGLGACRVFLTCGRYESLLPWNRRVAAGLRASGVEHRYAEAWAGHDWGAWRDWLEAGLGYLFPPRPPPGDGSPS